MFVFDTSAFINGSRHHYYLDTMASVWKLVEAAIDDGRVVVPREVYRELLAQDDEITKLVRRHEAAIAEPSESVQRRAGVLQAMFHKPGLRDLADPFVMAEAEARGYTVVTYEGITFAGERAKKADEAAGAVRASRDRLLHARASTPRAWPQAVRARRVWRTRETLGASRRCSSCCLAWEAAVAPVGRAAIAFRRKRLRWGRSSGVARRQGVIVGLRVWFAWRMQAQTASWSH